MRSDRYAMHLKLWGFSLPAYGKPKQQEVYWMRTMTTSNLAGAGKAHDIRATLQDKELQPRRTGGEYAALFARDAAIKSCLSCRLIKPGAGEFPLQDDARA
jgi:hypothetical protein